jgi:Fic family protein
MEQVDIQLIPNGLLPIYLEKTPKRLGEAFHALQDAEISTADFSFYTSVASVYSSKIEGEDSELDSYVKHKRFGISFLPDYTKKTDDLYNAYSFAQTHELNRQNLSEAHGFRKFRTQNMYVVTPEGKIEYVAASPFEVEGEMEKFYSDINRLLNRQMSIEEAFFYASMMHLLFVKIHPWNDGNGRSARLLEKWFLAQKLGEKAWFLQSEKMYYNQHQTYYNNLRILGLEYAVLDYSQALPFLLMLPQCFTYLKTAQG